MDWAQVLTILGANIGLFIWSRAEASQDRRQTLDILNSIHAEMKDFHGRLCAIEERRIK